jgi:type II secretory pathway pseudopilin PulG
LFGGMTQPDTLAPDQRAVLELVSRRGRSYGELSELLGIPERDVRARADAGLRALAGEPAPGVDSGRITDWLLGQQPDGDAARTRALVDRDAPSREWAGEAAARLEALGAEAVPEVPAGDAPPEDATATATGGERSSSRLGGALLLGALAVVVAGILALVLLVLPGDGDQDSQAADQQRARAEQAQQEQAATEAQGGGNDILLSGPGDSPARGVMRLFPQEGGTVQFAIAAENVPPNRGREVYAIWFTRDGGDARRLGYTQTQVGEDGFLTTGGPREDQLEEFPRWFATYDKVLVTEVDSRDDRRPGRVVLEGTLPGGG